MKVRAGKVLLSASDLVGWLGCRHLAGLEVEAAAGARPRPAAWEDPALALLQERGLEHEKRYVEWLGAAEVVEIPAGDEGAAEATVAAMRRGAGLIVQGTLESGRWFGRADLLRRVETASSLGAWSYEVTDTKLAEATHARTILQLCLYSELVGAIQGRLPECFHVVTPGEGSDEKEPFRGHEYRLADYIAYHRLVKRRLEETVAEELGRAEVLDGTYPDPNEHCDVCRWRAECDRRRRADDSVWLVAGVARPERRELDRHGIATLTGLARHADRFEPERVSRERLVRVREQARVQLAGRDERRPVSEMLPVEPGRGLARLPEPSPGDVFFDIEGDRMGIAEGREFLFGLAWAAGDGLDYACRWAIDDIQEREAFEWVVDVILERWRRDPGMHVYHYAPYEPAALKRLMGRYGAREDDIDRMLRAELFVDLCAVVRQSLRASVERYSLKELEPFHGFVRAGELRSAGQAVRAVRLALGRGAPEELSRELCGLVEAYNRDDCASASGLRAWLEAGRAALERSGVPVPRPVPAGDGQPADRITERLARVRSVADRLVAGLSPDAGERDADEQARWLLASILEYHRREEKVAWWESFRLRELTSEELIEERAGLGGLEYVGRVDESATGLPIHRYRFPEQESDVKVGSAVKTCPDGKGLGTVVGIDRAHRTVDLRKQKARRDDHPGAVYAHDVIPANMADSLLRLGERVAEAGVERAGRFATACQLLRRDPPGVDLTARPGESLLARARRLATELDASVLPIQGPPGAGKTYTAARMIVELVAGGAKVGVTAVSHKVIRNLLDEVCRAAREDGRAIRCLHKSDDKTTGREPDVRETLDNGDALAALAEGGADVLGGTAWMWARPEFEGAVDVLFVDEAGQMALANVLAVAPAGRSLVLVGDPQQLEQPRKGSHPDGADVSALEYLLDGRATVPPDRGLFLAETWRLAPAICGFTSELFYDGRLRPRAGLERQELVDVASLAGAGLFHVAVEHTGNQNSSVEEVAAVERIVDRLLADGWWIDRDGARARLGAGDILVIAPYNAQVDLLGERLSARGIRVGTVDKFQGQEAPVVIFSTATSTAEDAPRGMEFLYCPRRFNVATSRARCAAILVGSPRLFEPDCRTVRQVQLASVFCRFLEQARAIDPGLASDRVRRSTRPSRPPRSVEAGAPPRRARAGRRPVP